MNAFEVKAREVKIIHEPDICLLCLVFYFCRQTGIELPKILLFF